VSNFLRVPLNDRTGNRSDETPLVRKYLHIFFVLVFGILGIFGNIGGMNFPFRSAINASTDASSN